MRSGCGAFFNQSLIMKTKYNIIFYAIALVLLGVVLGNIKLWITAAIQYETFEQSKAAYLTNFPLALHGRGIITTICLGMLGYCILVFIKASQAGFLKRLSIFLGGFACVLFSWLLFTLM